MLDEPSHWTKLYLAHLEGRAKDARIPVKYSHAQELVAAGGGAMSFAAINTGAHPSAFESAPAYDAEQSEQRVGLCRNLDSHQKQELLNLSEDVFSDGENTDIRLAWVLAEHVVNDCEKHPTEGFIGSVALTKDLVRRAGEIATRDQFEDFQYESLPFPSIAPFATAKPDEFIDGRCEVDPSAVLNIIAALLAGSNQDIDDVLRYSKRLVPGLLRAP